ncbi:hypothetical protein OKW96_10020 [Sphingobacterium sp. KU25419]|nr:hypothetical protein OKW96_10020 [Sphingobacterium sp. KU25419]
MLFAIDVYYYEDSTKIVGVLFDWKDLVPQRFIVIQTDKQMIMFQVSFIKGNCRAY